MKIGAVYPQVELGGCPEAVRRIGLAAEEIGLRHLLLYDHVVGAVHEGRDPPLWGPYTENDPFHDPFVAFGYLSAITRSLEFVTGVLILPQRQTVLVAKQATDVDLLSNGRLTLGVGIGWNYVEYEALGEDFKTRGRRLAEQIGFLRRLWAEDQIDWRGEFDQIERANLVPRPERTIPVYCGGISEPAFQRAAKLADGFIFADHGFAIETGWPRVKTLLGEVGRSWENFGAHSLIVSDRVKGMSVQDAADGVRRWQDAGGTHASIVTMGKGFSEVDEHIDCLQAVLDRCG